MLGCWEETIGAEVRRRAELRCGSVRLQLCNRQNSTVFSQEIIGFPRKSLFEININKFVKWRRKINAGNADNNKKKTLKLTFTEHLVWEKLTSTRLNQFTKSSLCIDFPTCFPHIFHISSAQFCKSFNQDCKFPKNFLHLCLVGKLLQMVLNW